MLLRSIFASVLCCGTLGCAFNPLPSPVEGADNVGTTTGGGGETAATTAGVGETGEGTAVGLKQAPLTEKVVTSAVSGDGQEQNVAVVGLEGAVVGLGMVTVAVLNTQQIVQVASDEKGRFAASIVAKAESELTLSFTADGDDESSPGVSLHVGAYSADAMAGGPENPDFTGAITPDPARGKLAWDGEELVLTAAAGYVGGEQWIVVANIGNGTMREVHTDKTGAGVVRFPAEPGDPLWVFARLSDAQFTSPHNEHSAPAKD